MNRTQVAAGVDAVRQEDGFIIKALFTNTDPAQLVTDYPDFFFSSLHRIMPHWGVTR